MKKLVTSLFGLGANLRDMRHHLFQIPHKYPRFSELRKQIKFEDIAKDRYRLLASEFYTEKQFYDLLLLDLLDCESYEDLKRKKKSRYSAKQQKERGGYSWTKRKKEARERDGNRCVITSDTKPLFVHHINGDKTDNQLENLVTIARRVNFVIHHGARDFHPKDLHHWERKDSEYVKKSADRHELLKKYIVWLQKHGFPNACLESLPLSELASGRWKRGANKDIHFSMYRRRGHHNHYWVALLEPTGLSFEKQSFEESYRERYGRPYGVRDYDGFEEIHEEDNEATCQNCMFNGTEGCPFMDIGDGEKPHRCDQWHEIIEI
ncbi:MAG: hypothetical protein ACTSUB_07550 [Candidatus Thorarchaeota archaeon]